MVSSVQQESKVQYCPTKTNHVCAMMGGRFTKGGANLTMIRTVLLGIVAIVFLSLGQTSLKVGLNHVGGFSLTDGISSFGKLLTTPWFLIGFVCYGLSSIFWMDVLSKLDFSLAFPMAGSVYVFNLLIGRFFFHEVFGWGANPRGRVNPFRDSVWGEKRDIERTGLTNLCLGQ
jgi:multidrug transporter EmrE-like cation transporter